MLRARGVFGLVLALVEAWEVPRERAMRREPGRKKHQRNAWGLLDVGIDSMGSLQYQDDDDACEALCHAIDVTTVSKKCVDLSNEECASSSFYETLDNGDRRPCTLKTAAPSLSDPNAENCELDGRRSCKKGEDLCPEGTSSSVISEDLTSIAPTEDCQFCAGRGDFLPSATAYMEDGVPFTCQQASDRIRSGESSISCAEAADQLVDCCSGTPDPTAPADALSDCQLCLGAGTLNGSEIAMIIAGKDPMSCSEAEENLKKGLAPISCESARQSELVSRCCIPDLVENCSLCEDGDRLDGDVELSDGGDALTCGEVEKQLQNQGRSCDDPNLMRWKSPCCRCDLCDGRDFLPDAMADGDLLCRDATLRRGNGSMSCQEAKSHWAGSCCTPAAVAPAVVDVDHAASEAEAHGEEATPFCKSLCLKTDVLDWNMTCEELPKDDCISTHFFQTLGACERRLCVWSAPWTCALDSTQACLDCNWPCGRKATTSTTTTSTTSTSTTSTTSTTTTTFTTTVISVFGAETAGPSGSSNDDGNGYYVHGEEVPVGCFEFCARTDVRSMSLTCDQLSESQCSSGNFYQTDVAGHRRFCSYEDECQVDDSFVCNATLPICRVPLLNTSTSPPVLPTVSDPDTTTFSAASATTASDGDDTVEAVIESVEAAARECLASGSTDKEIWRIFQLASSSSGSEPVPMADRPRPADRALKKALIVAFLLGLPSDQLSDALRRAGVRLADDEGGGAEFCRSLCSKYEVANCSLLSLEFCRSGSFYQRLPANAGLLPCREDEETCTSAATSFFCNSTCIEGNLSSAPDPMGHQTFCRSLCSKKQVKHCSLLSVEACDAEEYYVEDPRDGFMLCQTAGDGRCSASVAAAVNSVHCQLSRFCGASANGTKGTSADVVASSATTTDTTTTTTAARSTTTAEGEVPLFGEKCGETCEVTADLCDGDWKQTGECSCHCKKYRPHIVMLLVNSLGFNDFVESDVSAGWPFLKSVLPQAIRINSSYVEVGSAPSRAAFLTGRWPRHLDWAASPSLASDVATGAEGWRPMNVSRHRQLGSTTGAFAQVGERTIAEKLNAVGYKSYAVGKWQAGGVSWKMTPGGRGFCRFYGSYDDAADYVKHCDMQGHYDLHYEETEQFEANSSWRFHRPYHYFPSGKDVVGKHVNSLFQAKAKQFIEDHQAKYKGVPMFLYYAPMTFQEPLQAPTWTAGNCTFQEGFGSAANSNRQTFCRMATSLDRSIQAIAQTMRGSFLGDNWVIVVASDSGGSASHKGSGGSNWPLRGSRGEVWEGGIRTRALIFGSHPELEAARSRNQTYSGGFLHLVDWHATLLHMAHATPSSRAPPNDMDGISLWRQILNDLPSPRKEMILNASAFNAGGGVCIRSGDFKLIMAPSGGKNPLTGENQGFRWPVRVIGNADYLSLYDVDPVGSTWTKGDWKLFNIRTDPSESTDVALLFPDEVKRLEDRLGELLLTGRRTFGDSLLKCTDCAKVAAKAIQVMRNHSGDIELNQCPIQEAAYPFWEEASELAKSDASQRIRDPK